VILSDKKTKEILQKKIVTQNKKKKRGKHDKGDSQYTQEELIAMQ
jgi:hypothetical protein